MFDIATKKIKLCSERRQSAGTADFYPVSYAAKFPKTLTDNSIHHEAFWACSGGCPACQEKKSDLRVSLPNNSAEIEADRIAERVLRMRL